MGALGFGSSVHRVVGNPSKSCFTSCSSTVGKGYGSSPSANSIPEMDVLFQRERTCPACKSLGYLDANAAEEQKSGHKLGAVCPGSCAWLRGCCAQGLVPGSTSNFPWYNNLLPSSKGRVNCFLWQYHVFAELLKIKID